MYATYAVQSEKLLKQFFSKTQCETNVLCKQDVCVLSKTEFVQSCLWPPYVIGGPLYFCPVVSIFYLLLSIFLFSSPNLSGRRLDVYHTSIHGVAL